MRGGIDRRYIYIFFGGGLWRFVGFLNWGWGPIPPVCDGTAPHWLMNIYLFFFFFYPPADGEK